MNPLRELQFRFVYTRDKRDKWTLLAAPTGPLMENLQPIIDAQGNTHG